MSKYVSKSIEDTQKIAREWLKSLVEKDSAFVVGLSGHLGAGKTAFVKCVAKELGIESVVTSPTYVIMKIYDIDLDFTKKNYSNDFTWHRLVHIDAYRLEKPEELEAIDWEGLVADKNNLILMEWPENVGVVRPVLNSSIKFDIDGDSRTIIFDIFAE